jgi:FkbM family methyltransferase
VCGVHEKLRRYFGTFGLWQGVWAGLAVKTLNVSQRRGFRRGDVPLPVPRSSRRVWGRLGTTDGQAFGEVFTLDSYDCPLCPRFVVDAGANVGYASVLFAERWPEAEIVALEPDASNFELLVRNTCQYPRIRPLRAALWSSHVPLRVSGEREWALRVQEAEDSDFDTVTMADLVEMSGGRIDLLKLDIEGAECDLFVQDQACLDAVGLMIVELHDWLGEATAALQGLLSDRPHVWEKHERVDHVWLSESPA